MGRMPYQSPDSRQSRLVFAAEITKRTQAQLPRVARSRKIAKRTQGPPAPGIPETTEVFALSFGSGYGISETGLKSQLGELKGSVIAVLGLTYKPGTGTLRRSATLELAHALAGAGASVIGHDPRVDRRNWRV